MEHGRQGVVRDMTRALTDLQTEWDAWHSAREAELATPHGWLSLRSLQWLTARAVARRGRARAVERHPGRRGHHRHPGRRPRGAVGARAAAVDGTVTLHPVDGKPGTLVDTATRGRGGAPDRHARAARARPRRRHPHGVHRRARVPRRRAVGAGGDLPALRRAPPDHGRRGRRGAVALPDRGRRRRLPRRRPGAAPRRPRRAGRRRCRCTSATRPPA